LHEKADEVRTWQWQWRSGPTSVSSYFCSQEWWCQEDQTLATTITIIVSHHHHLY